MKIQTFTAITIVYAFCSAACLANVRTENIQNENIKSKNVKRILKKNLNTNEDNKIDTLNKCMILKMHKRGKSVPCVPSNLAQKFGTHKVARLAQCKFGLDEVDDRG